MISRLGLIPSLVLPVCPLTAAEAAGIPATADPETLAASGYQALFDGNSLDGWNKVGGTGQFRIEDGAIVGFGKNIRGNTFLRTTRTYSDFILVFEFRFDETTGNSGCQFRSEQRGGDGRVFGYQCEHDNRRDRSFTAGVYDEARRGWLFPGPMSGNLDKADFTRQGQRLFRWNDWNTIAIRCRGRHIETWLNGEKRADFTDADPEHFTPRGFIALQVHGGKSCQVRWKNLFLKEL